MPAVYPCVPGHESGLFGRSQCPRDRSLSQAEPNAGDYSGLHTSTAEAAPIQKSPGSGRG